MLIWFQSVCFKSTHVQVDSTSAKKGLLPACRRDRETKASNRSKRCCIKDRLQLLFLVPAWNHSLKFYRLMSPQLWNGIFAPAWIPSMPYHLWLCASHWLHFRVTMCWYVHPFGGSHPAEHVKQTIKEMLNACEIDKQLPRPRHFTWQHKEYVKSSGWFEAYLAKFQE